MFSFLWNCLFVPFAILTFGLLVIFLLICRNSLHIRKFSFCLLCVISTGEVRESQPSFTLEGGMLYSFKRDLGMGGLYRKEEEGMASARSRMAASWAVTSNRQDFTRDFSACAFKQPVSSFTSRCLGRDI